MPKASQTTTWDGNPSVNVAKAEKIDWMEQG